jgi:hypothetical protein
MGDIRKSEIFYRQLLCWNKFTLNIFACVVDVSNEKFNHSIHLKMASEIVEQLNKKHILAEAGL